MSADDDELFRRPGTPASPSGSAPVPARRPSYPRPAPAPPVPLPPRAPAAPRRVQSEITLEGGIDAHDDDDEVEGGRRPLPLPILASALVAAVLGVFVGVLLLRPTLAAAPGEIEQGTTPVPTLSAPSATDSGTLTTPSLSVPVLPNSPSAPPPTTLDTPSLSGDALVAARLQEIRDRDLARVRFEGQWVAQLAAKYFGVVDPLQTTGSGGHTFGAMDVLAEYRQLRQRFGDRVVLLLGTDHSPRLRSPSGDRVWVTSFTGRFRTAREVQDWCERAYPRFRGAALADRCVPRRFTP
jgi:hypothetical protein